VVAYGAAWSTGEALWAMAAIVLLLPMPVCTVVGMVSGIKAVRHGDALGVVGLVVSLVGLAAIVLHGAMVFVIAFSKYSVM
jgi:hypothetical protein